MNMQIAPDTRDVHFSHLLALKYLYPNLTILHVKSYIHTTIMVKNRRLKPPYLTTILDRVLRRHARAYSLRITGCARGPFIWADSSREM